jgi:hypothetical protein
MLADCRHRTGSWGNGGHISRATDALGSVNSRGFHRPSSATPCRLSSERLTAADAVSRSAIALRQHPKAGDHRRATRKNARDFRGIMQRARQSRTRFVDPLGYTSRAAGGAGLKGVSCTTNSGPSRLSAAYWF